MQESSGRPGNDENNGEDGFHGTNQSLLKCCFGGRSQPAHQAEAAAAAPLSVNNPARGGEPPTASTPGTEAPPPPYSARRGDRNAGPSQPLLSEERMKEQARRREERMRRDELAAKDRAEALATQNGPSVLGAVHKSIPNHPVPTGSELAQVVKPESTRQRNLRKQITREIDDALNGRNGAPATTS